MFDAVLQKEERSRQRILGGVVSVAVHGAVLGTVAFFSLRHVQPAAPELDAVHLTFSAPSPGPRSVAPPPPAPPHAVAKPQVHPRVQIKPPPLVVPQKVPPKVEPNPQPQPPPEPEAAPVDDQTKQTDSASDNTGPGKTNGTGNNPAGNPEDTGTDKGHPGGGGGEDLLLGPGMTAPVRIADESPDFEWPREAIEAKVEGLMLANCSVTATGTLHDCKILKRLPHIEDEQVLNWLGHWKMKPAMLGGQPVSIRSYTIPIRLKVGR